MADEDFDAFADEEEVTEPAATAAEPEPKAEPETAEATSTGTLEDAMPASSESAEPTETANEPEPETVPKAAFLAVYHKNKEAERRLRKFEDQQRMREMPDPDEDPDGYEQAMRAEAGYRASQERLTISEEAMRHAHGEVYDQMAQAFRQMVVDEAGNPTDPVLLAQFQQSSNPALFAFQTAQRHLEVQRLLDPQVQAAEREKIKAEALQEAKAEILAELKGQPPTREQIAAGMPSLAQVASAGTNAQEREPGIEEMSLLEVFDDK